MNTFFQHTLGSKFMMRKSFMLARSRIYAANGVSQNPLAGVFFSRAMFSSRFGHYIRHEDIFRSTDKRYTNKSQRGLYHGRTHSHKYQVCFSDKRHRITMYPNVQNKSYFSDILNMKIKLPVTTYAMRNITKAGCFDNYILNTDPKKINSRMGMFLKDIMKKKMADPDFIVPYIPFSATVKRLRRRPEYLKDISSVYVPVHVKQNIDVSKYHVKSPEHMTRDEMALLEKAFKDPDSFRNAPFEHKMKQPCFIEIRKEMLALQPIRHQLIKDYLEKNRKKPLGRKYIMEMADNSEAFPKWILGDDYVNYRDVIDPELLGPVELDEASIAKIKASVSTLDADDPERVKREEELKKISMTTVQLKMGEKTIDFNPFKHHTEEYRKEKISEVKKKYQH